MICIKWFQGQAIIMYWCLGLRYLCLFCSTLSKISKNSFAEDMFHNSGLSLKSFYTNHRYLFTWNGWKSTLCTTFFDFLLWIECIFLHSAMLWKPLFWLSWARMSMADFEKHLSELSRPSWFQKYRSPIMAFKFVNIHFCDGSAGNHCILSTMSCSLLLEMS